MSSVYRGVHVFKKPFFFSLKPITQIALFTELFILKMANKPSIMQSILQFLFRFINLNVIHTTPHSSTRSLIHVTIIICIDFIFYLYMYIVKLTLQSYGEPIKTMATIKTFLFV